MTSSPRASDSGDARPAHATVEAPHWLGRALVCGLVVLTLVVPARRAGLWDPFELSAIDFARRIAVGLYGGASLVLDAASNALPTRGEVGRGELPFTSMALGLRFFGLHAAAARSVLAFWALVGVGATYVLVRRLADEVTALLSVAVLATTPLFFLHARTLLGDGVTMAVVALATAGLSLAVFDDAPFPRRLVWLALGALGLLGGLGTRGLLLGVAVPALGVGLACLLMRGKRLDPRARLADALGVVTFLIGAIALGWGAQHLVVATAHPEGYDPWLGFSLDAGKDTITFDAIIGSLGHALFPWSAFVPVALARLLVPSSSAAAFDASERGLRLAVVLVATAGVLAQSFVAPLAGVLPFGAVAPLAVLVAFTLRDLDRGAAASPTLGIVAGSLAILLGLDFLNEPSCSLVAFGVEGAHFPESLRESAARLFVVAAVVAALPFGLALLEDDRARRPAFARRDYAAWLGTVRDLWGGNLLFGACVAEASLLGFVAFDLLGERLPVFRRFAASGELTRGLSRIAWLGIPLLFALPLVVLAARDAMRYLEGRRGAAKLGWLLPSRGTFAGLGGILAGLALSSVYYPALARQLSPQESFETFRRVARPGDELAMVGASALSAAYAAGRNVVTFPTGEQAFGWLIEPTERRRFVVVPAAALGGMNSLYRGSSRPRTNLPVLDGRSSEIVLASNRLLAGEQNENPLDRYLPSREPRPGHKLDANLGNQLDVLGWDLFDLEGRPVASVVPGRSVELVIYYRVTARITGNWETFVHIDGYQRRFNADHPTLGGSYPFGLWRVGDFVADRYEFALEPNFSAGEYRLYFGLYWGSRRLSLKRGSGVDDRIEAGSLTVR